MVWKEQLYFLFCSCLLMKLSLLMTLNSYHCVLNVQLIILFPFHSRQEENWIQAMKELILLPISTHITSWNVQRKETVGNSFQDLKWFCWPLSLLFLTLINTCKETPQGSWELGLLLFGSSHWVKLNAAWQYVKFPSTHLINIPLAHAGAYLPQSQLMHGPCILAHQWFRLNKI